MRLTSFLQDRQLTVELTGEIDHHRAKEYLQELNSKIEAYNPELCILNFNDVTFMDSSGIAVVINVLRVMTRSGGRLKLINLQEQPKKVFITSGIDKLVDMEEVII